MNENLEFFLILKINSESVLLGDGYSSVLLEAAKLGSDMVRDFGNLIKISLAYNQHSNVVYFFAELSEKIDFFTYLNDKVIAPRNATAKVISFLSNDSNSQATLIYSFNGKVDLILQTTNLADYQLKKLNLIESHNLVVMDLLSYIKKIK